MIDTLGLILPTIATGVVAPLISALVGKYVARRVAENEIKKSEERAARAEALYHTAITYLRQVAEWATRNGIADALPDPPPELGLDF